MRNSNLILLVVFLVAFTACVTVKESSTLAPGERPELDTIEGGLWLQIEKLERETRRSGRLVKDKELNAYVKRMVCDLAGEYCSDIRVYILDVNIFNAGMYPNGMMHVYTGLLLRMQDESQLAAVLGHEIVHYINRHSLKRFVDIQEKADALSVFSFPLAVVGLAPLTTLASLATYGTIASYSRDHEREADAGGLKLLAKNGYSLSGAPQVWQNVEKEYEKDEAGVFSIFFASHPQPEERTENLHQLGAEIQVQGSENFVGREEYLEEIAAFRGKWFDQELIRMKFEQSEVLLQYLPPSPRFPAELEFFKGELFREQAEEDYVSKSIEAYQKAIDLDASDPRPRKAIGLMLMKTDDKAGAVEHMQEYLKLEPKARDALIIKSYIKKLGS